MGLAFSNAFSGFIFEGTLASCKSQATAKAWSAVLNRACNVKISTWFSTLFNRHTFPDLNGQFNKVKAPRSCAEMCEVPQVWL